MRNGGFARRAVEAAIILAIAAAAIGDQFDDTGKVMMWQVDSPAGTTYILGSLHFGTSDIYPLSPVIENAYARSDALYLEMNMDMSTQMQAATLMQSQGMYAGDGSLSAALTAEQGAKVENYMTARGMSTDLVNGMKPWFAAVFLATQEMTRLGFDPQSGLDMYFFHKATQSGKYIDGLESPEEEVSSLTGALAPIQVKELVEFTDQAGTLGDAYNSMAAAWKAGDAAGLNRLIQDNMSKDPEVKAAADQIIEGRNARMADRIAILANSGKTCFVIVGVAHLVTENSVLALLRNKGFKVTQVDRNPGQQPAQPSVDSSAPRVDSTAPRLDSSAPRVDSTNGEWHSPPPTAPDPKKPTSSGVLLPIS